MPTFSAATEISTGQRQESLALRPEMTLLRAVSGYCQTESTCLKAVITVQVLPLNFAVGDNLRMVKPSAQLTVRNYGAAHGRHSHDHFQVLWTLDGCLELEVEGKGVALAKGDGLLLQPSDSHDFEAPSGSRCLVLDTNTEPGSTSRPAQNVRLPQANWLHFLQHQCRKTSPRLTMLDPICWPRHGVPRHSSTLVGVLLIGPICLRGYQYDLRSHWSRRTYPTKCICQRASSGYVAWKNLDLAQCSLCATCG